AVGDREDIGVVDLLTAPLELGVGTCHRPPEAGDAGIRHGHVLHLPTLQVASDAPRLRAVRTVYLGTSDFAVTVLRRLAESEHRPLAVVTRPDRPRGRGRRVAPPPVAVAARELGIELVQPESVNADDAREAIAALEPEAVVICAFGAFIREPLLSSHPMLNVHPSLLPRWRGAAPIERAIEAADRVLDPAAEAAFLERRVRALTPHIGAFVLLPSGKRLGVRRAAVSDAPPPPPSEFAVTEYGRLLFGCVDGALDLVEVQPAG